MGDTVVIDGSRGEGGGQILRTALALSAITGRPLELDRIRARRERPGLARQHVACVEAAAAICGAEVDGAVIGSARLGFRPGPRRGGDFVFEIDSAGSSMLVMQTVIPALLGAAGPATVTVTGGTHNPRAPCFDFVDRVFAPTLRAMGAKLELELVAHGFYPAGGGRVVARIEPSQLAPVELMTRGELRARRAVAIVARLATHVATRELMMVQERLGFEPGECAVKAVRSAGPGNALTIEYDHAGARELVTGFGEKSVRAERVADGAIEQARAWLASDVAVGEHLADQLLVPMALAGSGRFRTSRLSRHATTNIDTIRAFLDLAITVREDGAATVVVVGPRDA